VNSTITTSIPTTTKNSVEDIVDRLPEVVEARRRRDGHGVRAPAASDHLIVMHEGEQAIGEPARGGAEQAPAHRLHGKQFPDVPDRKRVATGRDLQQYDEDHDADPC